ncbi:MAG: hypothetical protein R6V56_04605 [Lentisphaeria bacterium]
MYGDVDVNANLVIGDSDYGGGDPWESSFIYSFDTDLTQIKAYVREKDGTNHTVVPDGNACKWEVDVGDYLYAGHGESLSMHTSDVA